MREYIKRKIQWYEENLERLGDDTFSLFKQVVADTIKKEKDSEFASECFNKLKVLKEKYENSNG